VGLVERVGCDADISDMRTRCLPAGLGLLPRATDRFRVLCGDHASRAEPALRTEVLASCTAWTYRRDSPGLAHRPWRSGWFGRQCGLPHRVMWPLPTALIGGRRLTSW